MGSKARVKLQLPNGEQTWVCGSDVSDVVYKSLAIYTPFMRQEKHTPLFEEYAWHWFNTYHLNKCGARWAKVSKDLLEDMIVPFFHDKEIGSITKTDIQKFYNSKAAYSTSYVKKMKFLLNGIFSSAYEDGVVDSNVMDSKRYTITQKVTKRKALEAEEFRDIAEHLKDLDEDDALVLAILMYTGIRRGELVALQWKDVDLKAGMIHITQTVSFIDNTKAVLKEPKSAAGIRSIPILPELKPYLEQAYERRHPVWQTYVFNDEQEPATFRKFAATWSRIRKRINLHGATAHVFRHTFATLAAPHLDIKTLQAILGHSSVELTLKVYAHEQKERVKNAGEYLCDAFA